MSNQNKTIEILTRGLPGVRGPDGPPGTPGPNLISNTWTAGFISGGTGINDPVSEIPQSSTVNTYFNYTESGNFVFIDCQISLNEFNLSGIATGKQLSFRLPHASLKNTFICVGVNSILSGPTQTKYSQVYGELKAGSKIMKLSYPADSTGPSGWFFVPNKIEAGGASGQKFIFSFWYQKGTEIVDTISPTITLIGDNPINLDIGDTFNDPGANATDNVDASTVIYSSSGSVDTSSSGTYTLTYSAIDTAGNAATPVTRNVIVSNSVPSFTNWDGSSSSVYSYGSKVIHNGRKFIAVNNNFANYEPDVSFDHWFEVDNSMDQNLVIVRGIDGVGNIYNDYGVSTATDLNGVYVQTTDAVGFMGVAVNAPNFYKIGNGGTQSNGTIYICAPGGVSNYSGDQTWPHWTLCYLSDNRFDYLKNDSQNLVNIPKTGWQVFCPNTWDAPYAGNIDISGITIVKVRYVALTGAVIVE